MVVSAAGALLVGVLLAWPQIAAWRRPAHTYPDQVFTVEKSYRSVSGQVGGNFLYLNGMLRVEIGSGGLRISTFRLLQRWFPPFFVPWSEITRCESVRFAFWSFGLKLHLARWPAPVHIYSRLWRNECLAEVIETRWAEHQSQGPTAAGPGRGTTSIAV
jgi:hypothetical protein